jgi:glucose-1-phosphate thymidylyltransferase
MNLYAFYVIKMNENREIIDFVEKPQEFVSDLAMIGIYYFKDGAKLRTELEYLIDNNIMNSNEYQLPDALRRLTNAGYKFKPGEVSEWLDCGNKAVTVQTNQRVLEYDFEKNLPMVAPTAEIIDSVIIPPCFIGEGVVIENSVVGPHVSLGKNTRVINSVISNSNIQQNSELVQVILKDSMIGSHAVFIGTSKDLSLGDYSTIEE